jgi:uncharacterized protein DUF397
MSDLTPAAVDQMTGAHEVRWVKSSLSLANGDCVEIADLPAGGVAVRDSKNPGGPVLRFTTSEWRAFIAGARHGDFDQIGTR